MWFVQGFACAFANGCKVLSNPRGMLTITIPLIDLKGAFREWTGFSWDGNPFFTLPTLKNTIVTLAQSSGREWKTGCLKVRSEMRFTEA